jgi:hypothetical protein
MDPTATLSRVLQAAKAVIEAVETHHTDEPDGVIQALELAEAVLDLHLWLSRGGFPPRQWALKSK